MADYEEMAEQLLEIHASLNRLKMNQKMDVFSQGSVFALGYLRAHDGTSYPKEISRAMNVSTARVAALLNRMEEKGLISRVPDVNDTRKTVVTMTQAGEEHFLAVKRETEDSVVRMLRSLGEHDAAELLRIRKKMIESSDPPAGGLAAE